MKTEYLKSLGITDQATIDAIMAENGRDINAAKADLESQKEKVKTLEKSAAEAEKQIEELKKGEANAEDLRKQLEELQSAKTQADETHRSEIDALKKSHLVENGLRDARAKSVKAVMPFLDMDKITLDENGLNGLQEQVDALSKAENTSFLFDAEPTPSGLTPPPSAPSGDPKPATGLSFRQAVEAAINNQ